MAQVHWGKLLNGEEVAVKVQHRDLADQVEGDLVLMHGFVWIAKRIFTDFQYAWLVEEFDKNIRN
jgi:predicted unusual protein kinase regulating ubiquinone biosynthesis (AarF/ABC1/UbiB family)